MVHSIEYLLLVLGFVNLRLLLLVEFDKHFHLLRLPLILLPFAELVILLLPKMLLISVKR